jgi:hypothetical protein
VARARTAKRRERACDEREEDDYATAEVVATQ